MLGYKKLKSSLPDHQKSNMVAFYAVACTVRMHIVLLRMLY